MTPLPARTRPTPTTTPSHSSTHGRDFTQRLIVGVWNYSALLAFADLDIATHLAAQPLTTDQLADRFVAHPDSVHRLMRALAPHRLVRSTDAGTWQVTDAGATLRKDAPHSMRLAVLRRAREESWDELRRWPQFVTAGRALRRFTSSPRKKRGATDTGSALSPEPRAFPRPNDLIKDMIAAVDSFGALLVFADLKIAERLAEQPQNVTDLATIYGADPQTLSWMLHTLSSYGLLSIRTEGKVCSLRAAGQALLDDRRDSMRPAVLMSGQEMWWDALRRLPNTVRRGWPALLGAAASPYTYLETRPDDLALFQRFMSCRTQPIADAIGAHPFPASGLVVDVGGGQGTILAEILRAPHNRDLRGLLLERPEVAQYARAYLTRSDLAERCKVTAADFFAGVPVGGQTYLLASVVHNWPDAAAEVLLRRIAEAMAATPGPSRLLCVDMLLPIGSDQPHPGLGLDIRMMSLFGDGRERTTTEYTNLLHRAGFTVQNQIALPHGLSLIEATLAAR
ncbi:methyltransferase [Streptosporangium canum]|uniref:methyltransferase n=1 Tax=Streptosporangium canum TaxID=324952 RepID=UPI003691CDF6